MVLLTAEFFCGVNNDIASSRGCRHGRHGFPSRLPRVATSTVPGALWSGSTMDPWSVCRYYSSDRVSTPTLRDATRT